MHKKGQICIFNSQNILLVKGKMPKPVGKNLDSGLGKFPYQLRKNPYSELGKIS